MLIGADVERREPHAKAATDAKEQMNPQAD
jgi:hypothetical protein